jgi:hypothetical protein
VHPGDTCNGIESPQRREEAAKRRKIIGSDRATSLPSRGVNADLPNPELLAYKLCFR